MRFIDDTLSTLKRILQRVIDAYHPEKVILFGSWAWGYPREESDVDLLLIKESNDRFLQRVLTVRQLLTGMGHKLALDLPVLTPAEISTRLARGDQFIEMILDKGIVLYDASSACKDLDQVFDTLRASVTSRVNDVRPFSEIEPTIHKILDKLVPGYAPQKVLLFGTWATGRAHEGSDIDLLIIKETSDRFIDRWKAVRKILTDPKRKIGLDTLILSPREVERRLAKGDPFMKEILDTGVVLYAA